MVKSELEQALRTKCAKKPTSHLYAHLVKAVLSPLDKLRGKWLRDISHLDNDWDDIWDSLFKTLVSTQDKLIQFKIVHRAFFTPSGLHIMNPSLSSECWRCSDTQGDYTNIFWSCPEIAGYWSEVLASTNKYTSVPFPLAIKVPSIGSG